MRLDNLSRSLRVLLRADAIIADIQFRVRISQVGLVGAAWLLGVFGLLMLGISMFFALERLWGPVWAAAAVAGANFVVAAGLVAGAAFRKPSRDLELAREVHKVALESLIAEAKAAGEDLTAAAALFRHPIDRAIPGLIVPLASILLKSLRKAGKAAPAS